MNVGIVGSRRRKYTEDFKKVEESFLKIRSEHEINMIISGGAPEGGDKFAESISSSYNIPIKIYYPEWHKYGRIAGFMRNTDIAKESDILIACVHEDRKGGTEDTIKKFRKFHPNSKIILV